MKLGITVAANTIKKILLKNEVHPGPERTKGDWNPLSQAPHEHALGL